MLLSWYIPPRLASLTVVFLGAAAMLGYPMLKASWADDAIRLNGRYAIAVITALHIEMPRGRYPSKKSYLIDFAWRDGSGAERRSTTHISDAYAQQIAANGVLVTRQTTIQYLEEDRSANPIIIPDGDDRAYFDAFAQVLTTMLGLIGVAFAGATVWKTRRI